MSADLLEVIEAIIGNKALGEKPEVVTVEGNKLLEELEPVVIGNTKESQAWQTA